MIRRNYALLANNTNTPCQIHYREMGEGRAIVLLHASPLSSKSLTTQIELLSNYGRAIAWDTPGYGQSDSLNCSGEGLMPYVDALYQFIDSMGLDKPILYGTATGAQIAIEFAKNYPEQTSSLLLENVAWFTDDERQSLLKHYFPDIVPKRDGQHLQQVWDMVSQLFHFFPWYDTSEDARISANEVPAEIIHQVVMDYLQSGENYHLAYKAAFMNEKPEQLTPIEAPVRIIHWQGSILKKYTGRMFKAKLPDNIEIVDVAPSIEARFLALEAAIKRLNQ